MLNAIPDAQSMAKTLHAWAPLVVRPSESRMRGVLEAFVTFWSPITEQTLIAMALWADGRNRVGIPRIRIDCSTARSISIEVLALSTRWLAHHGTKANAEQFIARAHIETVMRMYGSPTHQKADTFCSSCLASYFEHLATMPMDPPSSAFAWFGQIGKPPAGPWAKLPKCPRDGVCLQILLQRIEAIRSGREEELDLLDMLPPFDTGDRLWSLPSLLRNLPTMLLMAFLGSLMSPSRSLWSSAPDPMSVNIPPGGIGQGNGGLVVASLDPGMLRGGSAPRPGRGVPAGVPAQGPEDPGRGSAVFPTPTMAPSRGVGAENPVARGADFPEELVPGGMVGRSGSRGAPDDEGGGITGGAGGRGRTAGGGSPGEDVVGGGGGTRGGTAGPSTTRGTSSSDLVQTTVTVQDMMVSSVMHRLGSRRSCTISLSDGGSYTIDKSTNSISGKFEKDPGERNLRVNRVLRAAMRAPQCEG